MKALAARAVVLCIVVTVGCLGTGDEIDEQIDRLEACRGSATNDQVAEQIKITEEYALGLAADLELSWHAVIFTYDFTVLWAQTVLGAAIGLPPEWSYTDDGVYHYQGATAAIELRLYDSNQDPVIDNVFDIASFLVGAQITYDEPADTTTIEFSSTGPLVEQLGLGPTPSSPLVLDAQGRQQLLESLGDLLVEPDFIAFAYTRSTALDYHVRGQRQTMAATAQGSDLQLRLVAINATRELTTQSLNTDLWDVHARKDGSRGYTTFAVTGGRFDYVGRIDFDIAFAPTRQLNCP